jgi:transposase-like protein
MDENGNPATLIEAVAFFADEGRALSYFAAIRWPDGVECPHCGAKNVLFLRNQGRWKCTTAHPRRQFSAKVGTIFEDSPLALSKWLVAVWLEANAKNSVSSYEVHRALGITQKSAWFMQQRVRLAMQSGSFKKMTGGVEVDETFIGGKARNMHADKRKRVIKSRGAGGKAAVMGLLDRHSREVRTVVIPNTKRRTLHPIVREHVEPGTKVFTDAHPAYVGLSPDFVHKVVDHAEAYVRGEIHTNGLENFWSLFKRCIKGTHVSVEPFHLFRFNNRKTDDGERFLRVVQQVDGKRLTYANLIGGQQPSSSIAPNGGVGESPAGLKEVN